MWTDYILALLQTWPKYILKVFEACKLETRSTRLVDDGGTAIKLYLFLIIIILIFSYFWDVRAFLHVSTHLSLILISMICQEFVKEYMVEYFVGSMLKYHCNLQMNWLDFWMQTGSSWQQVQMSQMDFPR